MNEINGVFCDNKEAKIIQAKYLADHFDIFRWSIFEVIVGRIFKS